MESWFATAATHLGRHPLAQGALAAACTLILEDPTTVISGLLVAEGKMGFTTAFLGLSFGIAAGDMGLYALGRLAGPKTLQWGLVTPEKFDRARGWFDRNLISAMIVSRFVPGMRIPTFTGAGLFKISAWRFLAIAVCASMFWTFALLTLTAHLGERVWPLLGRWRWPIAIAALAFFSGLQVFARRRMAGTSPDHPAPRAVSFFEFWPGWLFYIPVATHWMFLAIRHRSLTLPSAANPLIYSGGLVHESKADILDQILPAARPWFAAHARSRRGEDPESSLEGALAAMRAAGIALPVVAKPDMGQRGYGVQLVRDEPTLRAYVADTPVGSEIVLQEFCPFEGEAGILWWKMPGEVGGQIFSITLKLFPEVIGDGKASLRDLILHDPRGRVVSHIYFKRHAPQLDRILAEGERFRLVFAGNHSQGAIFKDGRHILTPELSARFDGIAAGVPEFYFGRFDLRFESLEKLRLGEAFKIVEINGAGAEATHIWDADAKLGATYKTLFEQFTILFNIGAANRRRGFKTIGPVRLIRDFFDYREAAARYPQAH